MKKILIGTTNSGKFHEIVSELKDLPFEFVGLRDVGLATMDVPEPHSTLEENAWAKAKACGDASGLFTISDDSGIFVDGLAGAPGVLAKRFGNSPEDCVAKVLQGLKGKTGKKRKAYLKSVFACYNPDSFETHLFTGRVDGVVAERAVGKMRLGMTYDCIFFHSESKKMFSEMTVTEKNLVSHRGRAINQLKLYFLRQFSFNQLVVPGALIIKDRKMFLNKRRDHNPALNNKWEFVGGGVDYGETVENCLLREVREETGFEVKVLERLPKIYTKTGQGIPKDDKFQVFLVIFIVEILKGKLKTAPAESVGHGWFTYNEALKLDFLPLNKSIIRENKKLLMNYID